MKKIYFLLICFKITTLLAQISNCPSKNQKNYSCGHIKEKILPTLSRGQYNLSTHFSVKLINKFENQNDAEKANKVIILCNQVLNDSDFWNSLENYKNYRYSVFEKDKVKQQISGVQIVNALINGVPNDNNRPDQIEIELNVELYGPPLRTPFESAIAKEIGDGKIYNKRWFFRKHSVVDIGSNWIHEFSHTKGLTHCFYCNEERDYSIPYVINRIFSEVAAKYTTEP